MFHGVLHINNMRLYSIKSIIRLHKLCIITLSNIVIKLEHLLSFCFKVQHPSSWHGLDV